MNVNMEGDSNAVMHTPTNQSKLQRNPGIVLRDLTNLPLNKDVVGSMKRLTSMLPPKASHCKSKNYFSFILKQLGCLLLSFFYIETKYI